MSFVAFLFGLHSIFPHYPPKKSTVFVKKKLLNKKCVLIFSTNLSEKFLILGSIQQDMITNYIGLYVKYLLLLSYFNETQILSRVFFFRKIFKYQILWNFVHWGEPSCPMRKDGLTDRRDEANIRFPQFCERL